MRAVTERGQSPGGARQMSGLDSQQSASGGAFLSLPGPLPPNLDLCLLPEFSRICQSLAELRYSTFHPLEGTGCLPSVGWGSASSSEDQESACGASGLARQERGLVPPRRSVPSGLTQLSSSRGRVRAALKLTASKRDENEETTLKCHFFPFRLAKFKA